ncbi:MAG: T9SS type A sorting domain-containing protein, partial [Saprospiraceae bacterium]|nr:T9SS type A sorting domain-containing protein [Saprospiraceae bacterium]
MKNQILNWLGLMLVFLLPGIASLPAQNPNWALVPSQANFTTSSMNVQTMPGTYATPVNCTNSAHDAQGNLLFYVVNDEIHDATGVQVGVIGTGWGLLGKEIIIIPDPNDCDARLVLSGSFDFLLNGGPDNYDWVFDVTRVKKNGSTWSIQIVYTTHCYSMSDNAFMTMTVSKPDQNGQRMWYIVLNDEVEQYSINGSSVNFINVVTYNDGDAPTDVDISPSGDRLMWSDAGNAFELLWILLNPSTGAMSNNYGYRPLEFTGGYNVYGLEFEDNNHVLVSAVREAGFGVSSGIIRCDFNTPVASQVIADPSFATSQLERALDGKIYATSGTQLIGITPGTNTYATTTAAVLTNGYFGGSTLFYALPRMLDGENYAQIFGCGCPQDVSLTGILNTSLIQSQTWIETVSTCLVNSNADVRLDADPNNGYVLLQPGFEVIAASSSVFVAQAFNGCANGGPQRPANERTESSEISNQADALYINVFPNPTDGLVSIELEQSSAVAATLILTDLAGKILKNEAVSPGVTRYEMSLENLPSGVYMLFLEQNG